MKWNVVEEWRDRESLMKYNAVTLVSESNEIKKKVSDCAIH